MTGDMLCVFDTKNVFSWVISKVDRGPWSHTAICTGEGTVLEAITTGVCERPLDVYATSIIALAFTETNPAC